MSISPVPNRWTLTGTTVQGSALTARPGLMISHGNATVLSLENDGQGNLVLSTNRSALLRTRDGREFDLVALAEAMMEVAERLAVLLPDLHRHPQFPALESAYRHYRTLHRLVRDEPVEDDAT